MDNTTSRSPRAPFRRFAHTALAALLLAAAVPAAPVSVPHAQAASSAAGAAAAEGSLLPARSKSALAALWFKWNTPPWKESGLNQEPYEKAPLANAPYSLGAVKPDYIRQALDAANFYRYAAGLPGDLETDSELNEQAQYGAVLTAANNRIDHYAPQPADMDAAFFQSGRQATESSNLFSMSGYPGNPLVNSVYSYMSDSDAANIAMVGHRRWLLNPPLKKVGFGLANTLTKAGKPYWFSAMKVFDFSRAEEIDYNYIAFPAQGNFPVEAFAPNDAWSVELNLNKYATPLLSQVTVSVTRTADGRTWTIDSRNNDANDSGGNYLNVTPIGVGSGSAVVFRPGQIDRLNDGDVLRVSIGGVRKLDGTAATLGYEVKFFHLVEGIADPDEAEGTPAGGANGAGGEGGGTEQGGGDGGGLVEVDLTDIAGHWSEQTVRWAVANRIVSGYPDHTFQPDKQVSEAEFLSLLLKAYEPALGDLPARGHWADPLYDRAAALNYPLAGDDNASQRDAAITRVRVAELIAAADGVNASGDEAIRYILGKRYASGKSDNADIVAGFQGGDRLTRAEAAQFIRNVKQGGLTKLKPRP
ncbi:CAP and S-layer homology domain-containing protein [Paenibacillus cymbidii]|uniref:CAP and S-layer homology domain-containing protein n=1 Tax=Paenibacillus cymbidii TaxID=1639034 RepID=UPI0014369814|nr:S-layer homology domain-containing protein [Paenibacillus cymbidii]